MRPAHLRGVTLVADSDFEISARPVVITLLERDRLAVPSLGGEGELTVRWRHLLSAAVGTHGQPSSQPQGAAGVATIDRESTLASLQQRQLSIFILARPAIMSSVSRVKSATGPVRTASPSIAALHPFG